MTPTEWLEHLGEKVDIVRGEPVLSTDGFLTVSASPAMYTLMVDRWAGYVLPIVPKSEYRGRGFQYRVTDCAHLYAEWSDRERGTDLMAKVQEMSRRDYVTRTPLSLEGWLLDNGFTKVDEPAYGDLVLLGYVNHVGAYLGDNKVLHHLHSKFSSVDTIDPSELKGVFRYGQ